MSVRPGAAALVGGDGEFLDEEGVAVGAFEDVVDLGGVGFGGEDAGDLAADLVAGEAGEVEAADGAQPVEFGEQGAQRVAAVDVVGAVGGEDDEAAGAQGAKQVGEEMAGGGVGPVQVLQGDDDGAVGGDALQEAGGEFEEAGHALLVVPRPARGLPQLGQQPGEFLLLAGRGGGQLVRQGPAQGAQRGGEGGEGQPVGADLDTAAERDDGSPAVGRGGELLDEPGLADPGLAADQQRLRLARGGAGERVVQDGQLVGAADEDGADGPGLHGGEHRTGVLTGGPVVIAAVARVSGGPAGRRAGRAAWEGGRPPCGRPPVPRCSRGAGEPQPAGAVGMRFALGGLGAGCPLGLPAGGAAAAEGLAGQPLVRGAAEEFGGAGLVDLVLVHGGRPLKVGGSGAARCDALRCLNLRLPGGSATSGEFRIFGAGRGLRRARGASVRP